MDLLRHHFRRVSLLATCVALFGSSGIGSSGCAKRFFLRIDQPAGAKLIIAAGPSASQKTLPIPFIAQFRPVLWTHYPVTLEIPAHLSKQYGGTGRTIRLSGKLYIFPATPLTAGQTLVLSLPAEDIKAVVQGRSARFYRHISDPNVGRKLAYIEFQPEGM